MMFHMSTINLIEIQFAACAPTLPDVSIRQPIMKWFPGMVTRIEPMTLFRLQAISVVAPHHWICICGESDKFEIHLVSQTSHINFDTRAPEICWWAVAVPTPCGPTSCFSHLNACARDIEVIRASDEFSLLFLNARHWMFWLHFGVQVVNELARACVPTASPCVATWCANYETCVRDTDDEVLTWIRHGMQCLCGRSGKVHDIHSKFRKRAWAESIMSAQHPCWPQKNVHKFHKNGGGHKLPINIRCMDENLGQHCEIRIKFANIRSICWTLYSSRVHTRPSWKQLTTSFLHKPCVSKGNPQFARIADNHIPTFDFIWIHLGSLCQKITTRFKMPNALAPIVTHSKPVRCWKHES